LQTQRCTWKFFRGYHVGRFVASTYIVAVFGLIFVGLAVRANVEEANAETFAICSGTQHTNTVIGNYAPARMAAPTAVGVPTQGAYIESGNPSLTHANPSTCSAGNTASNNGHVTGVLKVAKVLSVPPLPRVPAQSATINMSEQRAVPVAMPTPVVAKPVVTTAPIVTKPVVKAAPKASVRPAQPGQVAAASNGARKTGARNVFPYGQCTYWADQRYYQLHGVFVPWTTNANAGQWSIRAREFGWRVSSRPTFGAIIVLQGGVEGAYGFGHVGIVEQVLGNGSVIVSSMNWGAHQNGVTRSRFTAGPGVTFISQ
jgi:surface antigen